MRPPVPEEVPATLTEGSGDGQPGVGSASAHKDEAPTRLPTAGEAHFVPDAQCLVMRHRDTTQRAAGAGGRRGGGPGGTVPITMDTARRGSIGVYVDAIGTVTPVYTSSITSQVSGIVTEVHYREGQLVQKGASLIEIDIAPA